MTEVSVGHAWLHLRDSLESAATAWYLAELADRSLEERHAAEPLYALLRRAYELLDAGDGARPGRALVRDAPARRARRSGPRSTAASNATGSSRPDERFRWVPPLGGILCERCPGPAGMTGRASASRRSSCSRPTSASTSRRSRRCASRPTVERETEAALREFVRGALERDARSLAFLDEVRLAHQAGVGRP